MSSFSIRYYLRVSRRGENPEFRLKLARGRKEDLSSTCSFVFVSNKELGDLKDAQQQPCAGMWAKRKKRSRIQGIEGCVVPTGKKVQLVHSLRMVIHLYTRRRTSDKSIVQYAWSFSSRLGSHYLLRSLTTHTHSRHTIHRYTRGDAIMRRV